MAKKIQISFTGEYQNSLDIKNRLNIPAKFRKTLDPVNDRTFVITRGFDKCLVLYPLEDWSLVEQQLAKLSSIKGRHRNFVRSVTRYAVPVQYDGQGRIQISESLLKFSDITKEVAVIGMINKIELWSPSAIKSMDEKATNVDEKNFDDLANEINF